MPERSASPKNWGEMSLDYRLFFGFHLCMMVAIAAHFFFGLGIVGEVVIACCAALVAIVRSVAHRRKLGWKWPGAKWRDVLGALIAAALILFFIGAVLPGTSPLNPNLFPWCAAGANFLVFAVLSGMHVVCQSDKEFLRQCGIGEPEPPSIPDKPQIPSWKRAVAGVFGIYFILVWIGAVSFFWKFNAAYRHGSASPTLIRTEKLTNHGHTVYITPEEKQLVHRLEYCLIVGIPSVFVLGGLLHFVVGVKVFSCNHQQGTNS